MSTSTVTEYLIEELLDTTVCIMMFSWLRNAYAQYGGANRYAPWETSTGRTVPDALSELSGAHHRFEWHWSAGSAPLLGRTRAMSSQAKRIAVFVNIFSAIVSRDTTRDIADRLSISVQTVKHQLTSIFK